MHAAKTKLIHGTRSAGDPTKPSPNPI